jgi:hypothetical protein
MLLNRVSRRACSYLVSSGANGLEGPALVAANGDPRFPDCASPRGGFRVGSMPLFFGGTYFSDCAAFAREAVFSLVRLAAASRSAAASLPCASLFFPGLIPICITPKLPFLLSVFPFNLLGTGFRTRPSLLGPSIPSIIGFDATSSSSSVPGAAEWVLAGLRS